MKSHPTIVPKAAVTAPPIAKSFPSSNTIPHTRNNNNNNNSNHNNNSISSSSHKKNTQNKEGLVFLSTSKTQVPQQQQDALLSALGYQSVNKEKSVTKTSVWGTPTTLATKTTRTTVKTKEETQNQHPNDNPTSLDILTVPKEDANDTHRIETKNLSNTDHNHNMDSSSQNQYITDQVEYMRQLAKSRAERKRMEEESRILEQKERAKARLMALERNIRHGTTTTKDEEEDSDMVSSNVQQTFSPNATTTTPTTTTLQPLIIPNYYENRKSSTSTGPRMLFDPKSGSMVAAPTSNINTLSSSLSTMKSLKQSKSKNKKNSIDVDRKVNFEKIAASSSFEKRGNNHGTTDKLRGMTSSRGTNERKIPRTCGVLYTRDENGSYLSVDGCDGDQGYGYHLFPGGRIRNAKAYEEYEKEQETLNHNKNIATGSKRLFQMHPHSDGSGHIRPSVSTPLNRSHFMRKPQSKSVGVSDDTAVSSFKGDEKLDLLTGLDESPKLQATAAVWAPSQAVLDITAAKMKMQQPISSQENIHHKDDFGEMRRHGMNTMSIMDNVMITKAEGEEEDDSKHHFGDSPSIGLGLGFDPTKNTDSVIMSPTMDGINSNDLNISNLELSPEKSSSATVSGTKSILGSSPWTTTANSSGITTGNSIPNPPMGSLSDWDFTSHQSKNAETSKKESSSSFLSFGGLGGNQNTWGSTGNLSKSFHGIGSSSG
jgi:hypothetical protein